MPKFTFFKKLPYLGKLAAAVRGDVAGREERVAGRARAARLAVSPAAVVERVVSARLGGGHVPASNVVVAAVRGDFSSCRNRGHHVKQNKKTSSGNTRCVRNTIQKQQRHTNLVCIRTAHTRPGGCPSGLSNSCTDFCSSSSRVPAAAAYREASHARKKSVCLTNPQKGSAHGASSSSSSSARPLPTTAKFTKALNSPAE